MLHRLPENPVSFQVEFFANGGFTYRYDFLRLPSDAALTNAYVIAAPGVGEPFVLSRDATLEGECLSPMLDRNLSSLTFRRLEAGDQPGADRDGDGLTTEEELFVYGTDLGLADTSGDGITDGAVAAQGLDPLARNASDVDILARVAASATNAAFASVGPVAISRFLFQVKAHPNATISDTTSSSCRTITCLIGSVPNAANLSPI